jgi:simple sugar transport system ATP-binding protein
MEISDRISVLRDGRLVGTVEKAASSEAELARMMVGRESFGVVRQSEKLPGEPLLCVSGLCALDKKGLPALKDVNLEVRGGEILGIAGVSGNGQAELSQALSGLLKPSAGSILVEGQDLTGASPSDFAAANVGRVPEDRHGGVVSELTVAENLVLEKLEDFTRNGLLDGKAIQQNVLMARALSQHPRVLIVAQPTRGLDIGATDYVRSKLLEQRSAGTAVLMISEDLDEVIALADRIAVIFEGRIVGVVRTSEASVEQLGLMMSGALEVDLAQAAN